MGFDLEITFQGMCTFVPEREGKKLWVLMLDRLGRSGQIPPHAAAIRFPLDSLVEGTPGVGLRFLENFDIRISGQQEEDIDYQEYNAGSNQPTSNNPGPHSFHWVSPLEEACAARGLQGGGVIDPRFLKPPGKLAARDATALAARVLLTGGTVGTKELAGLNGEVIESLFRPPGASALGTDLLRPTAATVLYKTHVDADSVSFEATKLRRGDTARPLTLRPTGVDRNVLRVDIMNEEGDSLVGLEGTPLQRGTPRPQDLIFLSMFDVCLQPPADPQRPMPIPDRPSKLFPGAPSGIILDGFPPCSPGRGTTG